MTSSAAPRPAPAPGRGRQHRSRPARWPRDRARRIVCAAVTTAASHAAFVAFAARALPRAFGSGLDDAALAAHARRADAEIGARLVLACARERLVPSALTDMSLQAGPIRLPLRRLRAFELHAPEPGDLDLPPLPALLGLLHPGLPAATAARLAAELQDSAFNLALARAAADLRERACLSGHAPADTCPPGQPRPWPAPLDPESLVVAGHPWHPSCKARLGLRRWENLRHGPDLLADAPVHAVDLPEGRLVLAGPFLELTRDLFPPAPAGRVRLPVHALQLRRLPRLLGPAWGDLVRPAPVAPLPARALLSLRTVCLAGHPLHLKLAADIHTTSARRQVSAHSVVNGPRLAALLDAIQAADPRTRRGLRIQPDLAAAGLSPALGALAGQLGVIVRPAPAPLAAELVREAAPHLPPASHVCQDMSLTTFSSGHAPEVIVCAALGERRPGGDLLLRELSADYPGDRRARLSAFFADYLALLLPPLLRLLTAHGVALEAHLQNTLLVHDGRPRGFLVRDLGGVRVHRPRLAAAGHRPELAPGSFTITDDLAEAQSKLMHTLVHAHLAALIGWLDDAGGPAPAELWPRVADDLARLLCAWSREPALARACAEDRAVLLAPNCRAKALWTMRIDERSSDYAYTTLANALARA